MKIKYLQIIVGALFIVLSCAQEEATYLKLSDGQKCSLSVDSSESVEYIQFSTNSSWIADATESWITLKPFYGDAGNHTIIAQIDENLDYDQRTASIKIFVGGFYESIEIVQNERKGCIIEETSFTIGSEGGIIKVPVSSNVDYSVAVREDCLSWISVIQTKGLESNEVKLSVARNEMFDDRAGEVVVFDGKQTMTISVIQRQLDDLEIETSEYNIDYKESDIVVNIKTNTSYKIRVDNNAKSWVKEISTKALSSNFHQFHISENETGKLRQGKIFVDWGNDEETITISQNCGDLLSLSPERYSVNYLGGTFAVEISHNCGYSFEISNPEWISVSKIEEHDSFDVIQFNVSSNPSSDQREANITFATNNQKKQYTVSVVQTQEGYLSIENNSAGNLSANIGQEIKWATKHLVVSGDLNGSDISIIREMAGNDKDGNFTNGKLEYVDISDCRIVSGGDPYVFSLNTDNNVLGEKMFQGCESLKYVDLPNTIKTVGERAFLNCVNLKKLYIPQSVSTVGWAIIEGCTSIDTLTISKNVKSWSKPGHVRLKCLVIENGVSYLPERLFGGLEDGTTSLYGGGALVLPKSVKEIRRAFIGGLAEVYVDDLDQWFGYDWYDSFYGSYPHNCPFGLNGTLYINGEKLIELTIPEKYKRIPYAALNGIKIEKVNIPNTVTGIGSYAFASTHIADLVIPNSVNSLGSYVCSNCHDLKTLKLSNQLTIIPQGAFSNCDALEKINIPNSITDIKDRAFDCCSNVKTILLSTALLKIGNNAFDRCSSLEKVYANAKMPPMLSNKDNVFTGYDKNIVTLIVPKGSRDSYLQSDWALYFLPENIIEE